MSSQHVISHVFSGHGTAGRYVTTSPPPRLSPPSISRHCHGAPLGYGAESINVTTCWVIRLAAISPRRPGAFTAVVTTRPAPPVTAISPTTSCHSRHVTPRLPSPCHFSYYYCQFVNTTSTLSYVIICHCLPLVVMPSRPLSPEYTFTARHHYYHHRHVRDTVVRNAAGDHHLSPPSPFGVCRAGSTSLSVGSRQAFGRQAKRRRWS